MIVLPDFSLSQKAFWREKGKKGLSNIIWGLDYRRVWGENPTGVYMYKLYILYINNEKNHVLFKGDLETKKNMQLPFEYSKGTVPRDFRLQVFYELVPPKP